MAKKQFRAESKRLLDLMINSIYTNREIFLREIISNASDAMDKLAYTALTDDKVGLNREDMAITITRDEKNRTITVSDTGIGMSKEFLPKVFQAFAQEHDATTSSYGGSGLGLSIAKNFARMMGGDITVESEEGVGTTFTVEVWLDLAIDQKEDGGEEMPMDVVDFFLGKRILLVEDHPLNTVVARRLLEKQALSPESALTLGETYETDGAFYGIKVYDAQSASGILTEHIAYEDQDYDLAFGRHSLHNSENETAVSDEAPIYASLLFEIE